MKTNKKQGSVKVVNALATIHKILEEIAPNGVIHCQMKTSPKEALFTFSNNGIEATLHVGKGGGL